MNGVPIRRVNQRYVIATSTKVPVTGVNVTAIDDKFFAREKEAKRELRMPCSLAKPRRPLCQPREKQPK